MMDYAISATLDITRQSYDRDDSMTNFSYEKHRMYSCENMHVHIQVNERKWAETTDYTLLQQYAHVVLVTEKNTMQTTNADDTVVHRHLAKVDTFVFVISF